MQGFASEAGTNGLHRLATAIARSTALHVAMSVTEESGGIEEMLANAEVLANWINRDTGVPATPDWRAEQ